MKKASAIFVIVMLSACQPAQPPEIQAALAQGENIKAELNATTDSYGWTVHCADDHHKAERTCRASKFGEGPAGSGIPFQVYYVNREGPFILAGHNTFPGREATIRVDSGPVISASNASAVVRSLNSGTTAYVVYHVWPTGERKMTVDIRGFDAAYKKLRAAL